MNGEESSAEFKDEKELKGQEKLAGEPVEQG
jgi:hypothetical protein